MNIRRMLLGIAVLCGFSVLVTAEGRLTDDVNVFVGTDGFGSVYPGPQVPFGGIQISPVWFILKAIRSGAILLNGIGISLAETMS